MRPGKGCGAEHVCCSLRCRLGSGKTSEAAEGVSPGGYFKWHFTTMVKAERENKKPPAHFPTKSGILKNSLMSAPHVDAALVLCHLLWTVK